jgi:hypothetical protein
VTHKITPPGPDREVRRLPRLHLPVGKREKKTRKKEKKAAVRVNNRPVAGRRDLPWILRAPRMMFLVLSGAMVFVITIVGMVESWRNLYEWGLAHHWGAYAVGVPVLVDFFILTSEMLLFVLIVDGRYGLFSWFTKVYLWFMFLFGLGLSLAGNVDHLRHVDIPSRIGFALPPLASAMGMASILMVLKMIAEDYEQPGQTPALAAPAPVQAAPAAPPEPVRPEPVALVHPAPEVSQDARILVPPVAHHDPVAHPVAHDGAPGPVAPKVIQRPVNGATRPAPGRGVPPTDEAIHAARQYLAQLRRDGIRFPSDRRLAASHFPSGEPGKGNRRAAQRVLEEFNPKEAT